MLRGARVTTRMCKKNKEQHQGDVWVESKLDKGAEFILRYAPVINNHLAPFLCLVIKENKKPRY